MRALLLLILLSAHTSFAQLNMIETEDMSLVTYDFGHKYILPHAGRCFHNALEFHRKLFDYEPSERITVLIQDFGDYGNGGATAVPVNAVSMGLSPFSYAFETSPAGERVFSLMNHELVHVVALDNSTRADRFFHKLFFGKVHVSNDQPLSMFYSYLTSPRRYSPRWYHEGIASYVETWMSGGVGLALGNYDEMVFRTRVLEDARIYSAQGLESEGTTTDFQGKSNSYLYGTRFMGYLAYKYGPEKMIEWVKRKDGSKRLFSAQFKHVFGKPINEGWDEWIEFERDFQRRNIKTIGQNPVTVSEPVTQNVLGSVSYAYHDKKRNKVYVAVNYPGKVPHLAAIDLSNGKLEHLTDIKGAALFYVSSIVYDEKNDLIFFTTDNDAWRDLNSYNLVTGETIRLQKDFRTGDLAFNDADESIWGIKHLNGYSTIVRIPKQEGEKAPYSTWEQIYTLPYGQDIFDIDISPDGKKLSAAVSDYFGDQRLLIYDIEAFDGGSPESTEVYNFEPASPQSFRYTEDGRYLIGSSYLSGVSNILRLDAETFEIEPMSNALTGYFRPILLNENQIFAFKFKSDGFIPVTIPNKVAEGIKRIEFLGNMAVAEHPMLMDWELKIPGKEDVDIDALTINEGAYKPMSKFRLNQAYPILVGYKNWIGLGYKFSFGDPLSFRTMDLSFSYTPTNWFNELGEDISSGDTLENDERFHASMHFKAGRFNVYAGYNEADFYDLFGPTKRSRRGATFAVNYNRSLIWDPPKRLDLNLNLGGFYGLDRSPEFQKVETTGFDDNLFYNLNGSLSYSYVKNSMGAVDYEKGFRTSVRAGTALTGNTLYPTATGTMEFGFQLPFRHTSLWFRTAAGNSFSETFNPFTRFGFAAFGNNYVDYMTHKRYRNTFSFPGLSFNADKTVIAKSFTKAMADLVLPPIRYRKLGFFNLYANWTQSNIFTTVLNVYDFDNDRSEQFINLGAQVDTRLVMFSLNPATLSFGFARAWNMDQQAGERKFYDEWMVSLKLLK